MLNISSSSVVSLHMTFILFKIEEFIKLSPLLWLVIFIFIFTFVIFVVTVGERIRCALLTSVIPKVFLWLLWLRITLFSPAFRSFVIKRVLFSLFSSFISHFLIFFVFIITKHSSIFTSLFSWMVVFKASTTHHISLNTYLVVIRCSLLIIT